MSINSRIKERREELEMSRQELADKIGVTPSAIANYENGVNKEFAFCNCSCLCANTSFFYAIKKWPVAEPKIHKYIYYLIRMISD